MAIYNDKTPMPFGKFEGTALADVPASYLLWLNKNLKRNDWYGLKTYIEDNLEVLEKEVKEAKRYNK